MTQGYTRLSVDKAIELTNIQLALEIPKIKEKPEITYKIIDEETKTAVKQKNRFTNLLNFFRF